MDVLGGVASVIAVVQLSGKLLSLCGKYYTDAKDAKDDIENLRNEITAVQAVLQQSEVLTEGPGASKLVASKALIEKTTWELKKEFERLEKILHPGVGKKAMSRFGVRTLKWPLKKEDVDVTLRLLERHKTTLITALNTDQMVVMLDMDRKIEAIQSYERSTDLSKLPRADGAAYNHRFWEHEDQCLPDTRVELLRQIMAWSKDASGPYIFWLNGMAGTGKSTISRTVARTLDGEERLAASFFFSRGRGDIGHAGKFFTTIAAQLASRLPVLRPFVLKALDQHLDISQQGLSEQWKHLILEPLSSLKDTATQPAAMVIVIDALDECEKEEDMQLILALLAQAKQLSPIRLQVFVTSRPETPIHFGFRQLPGEIHQDFVLHDIPQVVVSHDISVFFQQKLALVKALHDGLSSPWPDETTIELLVERAVGLFIYAATTYRFIRNNKFDPEEQLSIILEESNAARSPTKELDSMYTQILRQSIIVESDTDEHEELLEQFRNNVGSIVIMFDVMATKNLAALLHLPFRKAKLTLNPLRSVLNVPEIEDQPVRTLHPSFRDFLLSQERCFDKRFWIDEKEKHNDVLRNCLQLMFKRLRRDMCDLHSPGTLVSEVSQDVVQKAVSSDLQYACCYWVDHLQRGTSTIENNYRILEFLNTHFLHWLEVLSLIGKVSDGLLMVTALEAELAENTSNCQELSELTYDAKRFMLENRSMLEVAPLQVYYSALLFSPERSLVKKKWKERIPWILMEPKVMQEWTPMIQTLEGHSEWIKAVVFSPDGKLVASASFDKTVRLWNASTGASHGALEGHSEGVNAVVFSPDGKFVASASWDKTVRLWDTWTGASRGVLEGHSDSVTAVVFSPDGKIVASASWDQNVRLWDTSTGAPRAVLEGHSGWVNAVLFTPDGKLVASASSDKSVRLWDILTGASRGVLQGHSYQLDAVVFSPDGKLVASGSRDETVRLWDTATGASRGVLEGHSDSVTAVVFCPDGKILASGSRDETVRLWDTSTGASRGVLEGHSEQVYAVVFSPDGKLVASASFDKTVRLWDASTGASYGVLEGHSSEVSAAVFSPDGKLVVSASFDKTVRLWRTSTAASRSVLGGHSDYVKAVVFSPDGKLVASASGDRTVRVWDTSTGTSCGVLEGHLDTITAVVFSPDGKLVASGSRDGAVRLWAIAGNRMAETIDTDGPIHYIAFSDDGAHIHTNRGSWALTWRSYPSNLKQATISSFLNVTEQWVTYHNKRLIWLPWDYRTRIFQVHDSCIVLGLASGHVSFISFDSAAISLAFPHLPSTSSPIVTAD